MHDLLKNHKEYWDLFVRTEEYSPSFLDKHRRFPYFLSKNRDVLEPKVSELLVNNGYNFEYPDEKNFAVCLSHDVDKVLFPWKKRLIKSAGFTSSFNFKSAFENLFCSNQFNNIKEIMDLEEKYKAKSTFFFVTSDENNSFDPSYKVYDLKDEIKDIDDRGWEVGLHGGYHTYNDLNKMKQEKKNLEDILKKKVVGYRNHFLRFKTPDTWEKLSKAGFKYDTTYGYPDMVGFRNGMCHPFKPYSLNQKKEIDILEIPLMIMDVTLLSYMHLNLEESFKICKKIIERTRSLNGVLTILWHNRSFSEKFYPGWKKLYEKILGYCYEKNAWMTSGEKVYDLCKNNNLYFGD
ncbi:MAG: polysaccharide deacetylase family protein [Candidatus Thermoplasmatota archaeon]